MSFDVSPEPEAVAVLGMAGRFPGASSVAEFWRNQVAGIEAISFFGPEELESEGVPRELSQRPEYVPARGVLDRPEHFDAEFFGLSAREAEVMDPQIRLFLECAWEACENAGYDIRRFAGRAGVYAGASPSSYLVSNLMSRQDLASAVSATQVRLSNGSDFLSTWTAYRLNLRGPAVAVQTACSTSLAAVHFACQGLLAGECELALAGGSAVSFPHRFGYLFQEGGLLSPDGHCRSFDAEAKGAVPGNGVGVVVLKRLSEAIADGDPIRAVIRATALNNDGSGRAGFTAPGVEGQSRVIAEALALAQAPPETVGYVEAHGSGTALGDPIEIAALTRAFRGANGRRGFCALGSAKSTVGHLDCAAGVAGLIRAVYAVGEGRIPPSLHYTRPNPQVDLESSPFYVPTEARDWPSTAGEPRRAGVSSFGLGGTNVHAIVEEPPPPVAGGPSRPWQPLLLSARSAEALERARTDLLAHLQSTEGASLDLPDVAYTLTVGRHQHGHRLGVVCRDRDDAVAALSGDSPHPQARGAVPGWEQGGRPVAFLLPGLGEQSPDRTLGLYLQEPTFRRAVDECCALLEPRLGLDLRELLYPSAGEGEVAADPPGQGSNGESLRRLRAGSENGERGAEHRLLDTRFAHTALFVAEYALAQLLGEWGLRPRALLGYSLGEYVAACLAGVFTPDDALALVADRARLIAELPPGRLLAVALPPAEARAWIEPHRGEGLALAAANGPGMSVLGGPTAAIEALARRLADAGLASRPVRAGHAFHTPQMEPIRRALRDRVAEVPRRPPQIPFVSNLTGRWIRDEEATDPDYWAEHLVSTVDFAGGVGRLLGGGEAVVMELGSGETLATLVRQNEARVPGQEVVEALPAAGRWRSEPAHLLSAASRLWVAGADLDGAGLYRNERRRRVPLPTYPFQRRRYWIAPGDPAEEAPAQQRNEDLSSWFHRPTWQRCEPVTGTGEATGVEGEHWLLLLDRADLGRALAERLREGGAQVTLVSPGARFAPPDEPDGAYGIDPRRRRDYDDLLEALAAEGALPRKIVHLGAVSAERGGWSPEDLAALADGWLEDGFGSLFLLVQALADRRLPERIDLEVISSHVHDVTGEEILCPPKAAILGACQVTSQENPQVRCRSIDLELPSLDELPDGAPRQARIEELAGRLLAVLGDEAGPRQVALRGRRLWRRGLEPTPLGEGSPSALQVRSEGAYLVTVGAESGLVVAEHLARRSARLVLLVPPELVDSLSDPDGASEARDGGPVERLERIRALARELEVVRGEPSDEATLAAAVAAARERFQGLDGVVHVPGSPAAGLIPFRSSVHPTEELARRVAGTLALARALSGIELDFFVVFSSTVGLLGGAGQADACAAAAFTAAFARYHSALSRAFPTVVGWDGFRWEAAEASQLAGLPGVQQQIEEALALFGIDADECVAAFDRLLAHPMPEVFVSPRPLVGVLEEADRSEAGDPESPGSSVSLATEHPRPELPTPYREPSTPTEETVLSIWREAFGTALGVDDSFFELGGNSLLALQILTRLRSAFGVDLPVGTVFEHSTAAELAAHLDGLASQGSEEFLEELLAEVEGLSAEEAETLWNSEREAQ